jgi:hypothetical protein
MSVRIGFAHAAFSMSVLSLVMTSCANEPEPIASETQRVLSPNTSSFSASFARQWMVNVANSVKNDVVSPPVAARTYAYTAIGIYESVVHGMPGYQSLAGQLNGLDSLPTPDPALQYDWPTVMAQTMHNLILGGVYTFPNRAFFEHTTLSDASLKSLGPVQIGYRRTSGVAETTINNSIAFGDQLGAALVAWSNADGYYALRYKGWIPPKGPDKWVPTGFSDTDKVVNPLEPWFGHLRPLVMTTSDECAPANLGLAPPPFSTDPTSAFYQAGLEVYNTEVNLTDQQEEIANFWADGPGATPTPAGHWVAITTKLVRNTNLATAAAGYVWVSMGFLDSFIAVWQEKFSSNLLRPETYIRRHIDPGWKGLLPTPPFPTYTSGHSGQSMASATLLTAMFGGGPFVDDTKLRRGFAARSFANFTAMAEEAAASRLYGGIHFRFDNDDGLAVGDCVGNKIIDRVQLTL